MIRSRGTVVRHLVTGSTAIAALALLSPVTFGQAQAPVAQAPAAPQPFIGSPNVPRSDLPALARQQLRTIRTQARAAATAATDAVARAHWQDIVDRVDAALEPPRG